MNAQQAKKLLPLVNNPEAWEPLEEHLQQLGQMMQRQLVVAESELEMRRLQGKLALLETLQSLKVSVKADAKQKE